jgi:hypothetical protein
MSVIDGIIKEDKIMLPFFCGSFLQGKRSTPFDIFDILTGQSYIDKSQLGFQGQFRSSLVFYAH